jgi:hypothetical protein
MQKVTQSSAWQALGPILLVIGCGYHNLVAGLIAFAGAAMIALTVGALSGMVQRQEEEIKKLNAQVASTAKTIIEDGPRPVSAKNPT